METKSPNKLLGQRIQQLRWSLGLTLEKLGQKAGITGEGVRQIEAGRKRPRPITLCLLAKALGADPYVLAKESGFEERYLLAISGYLINVITDDNISPRSPESQILKLIEYGEELLRDGLIQLAKEKANQVIGLMQAEKELSLSLLGGLFRAYDLLVNIDTRVCGDTDLDEALEICRKMQELAETELITAGGSTEISARVHYRFGDVYMRRQDYSKSLEKIDMALSKARTQKNRGEAFRVKLEALRSLGDRQQLERVIREAMEEIHKMRSLSHVIGCLGQELALSLSLIDQLAGREVIEKVERLYHNAHKRRGFIDNLLEVLFLTRRAQITSIPGPGYDPTMAKEAARLGIRLARNHYNELEQQCRSVLLKLGECPADKQPSLSSV